MKTPDFSLITPSEHKIPQRANVFMILTGVFVIIAVPLILLGAFLPGDGNETWRAFIAIPGILCLVLSWVANILNHRTDKAYTSQVVAALARANNLTLKSHIKPKYDKYFYPAIAQVGVWAREVIMGQGVIAQRPVAIYAHTYLNNLFQFHRKHLIYVKVDFDVQLPHIVLQTRQEEGSRFVTSLGRTFDDNQRVSLQGKLDKYFLFYTHRRTVTDALTVLSPQLLEQLQKLNCTLSMETVGRSAYFYFDLPDGEEINLRKNLTFINTAVASIKRTTRTDFMKLPNDSKYPFLRSRPTGGVVEWAGKYFNYAVVVVIGQYIWSMTRLFINTTSEVYPYRWWFSGVGAIGTAVVILYLLVARSKYTRTKLKRGY